MSSRRTARVSHPNAESPRVGGPGGSHPGGWACALLASALVLFSTPAGAQPSADPRTEAKAQLGPIYLTPAFAVKELGIDSNVFNSADARRDFTVTLSPRARVWVPFARRALLTTMVGTDLVYYATYASERSVDPDVRLRGELFLNRVTLFAEPAYRRTRQRLNYELDARAARHEASLSAGGTVQLSRTTSVKLGARRAVIDFDADEIFNGTSLQETLNRESRAAFAIVRTDVTPLTTLLLRAERGVDRFELSPVRDADTVSLVPGVEFKPAALISGSASVGFRSFAPRSPALAPFRGLVTRAALDYILGDSTRFHFSTDRDVNYSFEPAQPYYVVSGYGVQVARRLVGRTDMTVAAQRHRYSYRDLGRMDAADAQRVDSFNTWTASLGYRMGRVSRVSFGFSYFTRHSNNLLERDYEGLRLGATAEYGF
jgi:hypothetical protein